MNLFIKIKNLFSATSKKSVFIRECNESVESNHINVCITKQLVIDKSGVHEVFYTKTYSDFEIGDVLPEQVKQGLMEMVR